MSSTTTNLTNINFMSESKYDSLSEINDDELYAVKITSMDGERVINQNSTENPVKMWTGTTAQYNALQTKDSDTIYHITDDEVNNQTILEMIYPVGSIYIGTMNICPLSALFGTWEKVSSGRVLQGADNDHQPGTTIDAGLPNITGSINHNGGQNSYGQSYSGALSSSGTSANQTQGSTGNSGGSTTLNFNASSSSSVYGNSDTVQPPAFVVNIWKRTA